MTPAADVQRLSHGEIVALCTKAARGAGMPWGLAEEAGFAAAWLAERGCDGPWHLLCRLDRGEAVIDMAPQMSPGAWTGRSGRDLCPIATGAALSEVMGLPEGLAPDRPLHIGPVVEPVLLVPFLTACVDPASQCLTVATATGTWDLGHDPRDLIRALAVLERSAFDLRLSVTGPCEVPAPPEPAVIQTSVTALSGLDALALRTTDPASNRPHQDTGPTDTDHD